MSGGGIRIAISVFLLLVWLPVSFYLFVLPYRIYMKEEGKAWLFYALSAFAVLWFFIWSIADFADANGFVMVASNVAKERSAAAFFGAVTAILMMGIAVLSLVNAGYFCRRSHVPADE